MKRVILESPFAGDVKANKAYARRAMKHSLSLGEAPLASHLLYTQMLDDNIPEERQQGIDAGLAWRQVAELAVFYVDRGMSTGMKYALEAHLASGVPVEFRRLSKAKRPKETP